MPRPPEQGGSARLLITLTLVLAAWGGLGGPPSDQTPGSCDTVRFGLLISERGDGAAVSESVRRGAEMAVAEANAAGGYAGCPFELVVRSDDGPWGTGTRRVTELVYEDRVWGLLGGLDGRSAHLAEQVVTKAQVVLVTPWASEPTLAQARVPWFFRLVPDDDRQALALVEAITVRGLRRLAVVADETYDARMARDAFLSLAAGMPLLDATPAEGLNTVSMDGIVLFGAPAHVIDFLRRPETRRAGRPVFGGLALTLPAVLRAAAEPGAPELTVVRPGHWGTAAGRSFAATYAVHFGHAPSAPAAYAYDAIGVLVAAVRAAGLNRARLRDALAATHDTSGVTGPIRFDSQGNRDTAVVASAVTMADVHAIR